MEDIDFPDPEMGMFTSPIDLAAAERPIGGPQRVIPYPPKMSSAAIEAGEERVAKALEKWFLEVFGT